MFGILVLGFRASRRPDAKRVLGLRFGLGFGFRVWIGGLEPRALALGLFEICLNGRPHGPAGKTSRLGHSFRPTLKGCGHYRCWPAQLGAQWP